MISILKRRKYLLSSMVMMFMSFNLFANTLAIDEARFLAFHKAALPDSSVVVVDVTNPGNPVQINNIDISEGVRSLYLDKTRNLLFVSLTVPGIQVFDVSDINTPTLVGSWTEGASFNLSIQDNIAYVATNEHYFDVLDTNDISNMQLLARIDYVSYNHPTTEVRTSVSVINDGLLWIGGTPNNINVFEITTPAVLNRISTGINYDSFYNTKSIGFGNNIAVVVNGSLETRDTTAVTFLDRIVGVRGLVSVVGNYAYVGYNSNVRIIDFIDPGNPVEVGVFKHTEEGVYGTPTGMVAQGNILFIVHGGVGNGFEVFDVSNPVAPVVLARISNKYSDGTTEPTPEPTPEPNVAPTANAGVDQYKGPKQNTLLDGSNSFDSDGSIVSYKWVQTSGRQVSLKNAQSSTPGFTTPGVKRNKTRTLVFQLTVTDDQGSESIDSVSVYVSR